MYVSHYLMRAFVTTHMACIRVPTHFLFLHFLSM